MTESDSRVLGLLTTGGQAGTAHKHRGARGASGAKPRLRIGNESPSAPRTTPPGFLSPWAVAAPDRKWSCHTWVCCLEFRRRSSFFANSVLSADGCNSPSGLFPGRAEDRTYECVTSLTTYTRRSPPHRGPRRCNAPRAC